MKDLSVFEAKLVLYRALMGKRTEDLTEGEKIIMHELWTDPDVKAFNSPDAFIIKKEGQDDRDHAWNFDAFPCNVIPFLKRMDDIAHIAGSNSTELHESKAFRANLHIVNSIIFGQCTTISLFDDYTQINGMKFPGE